MSGPLALIGETLLKGSGDYQKQKQKQEDADHDRARQELLADEARRRDYQLSDRADERTYEQKLYNDRRYDALKVQLMKDGYLSIADADKPDAVTNALKKGGVEYSRTVDELAGYKAALPKLIEATGDVPGASQLLSLTPDKIDQARALMQNLTAQLGKRVQEDRDRGINNAKNGAALISVAMAQKNALSHKTDQLNDELQGLQNGEPLDAASEKQAKDIALSMRPDLAKKKALSPADMADLNAEVAKQEGNIRLTRSFQLSKQLGELGKQDRNLNQQFDNVASNMKAGAYAFIDPSTLPTTAHAAAPVTTAAPVTPTAPKVAPGNTSAFLDSLSGKSPSTPGAPMATPVSGNPAALGAGFNDYLNLGLSPTQAVGAIQSDNMPHRFNPINGMPTVDQETDATVQAMKAQKDREQLDQFLQLPPDQQRIANPALYRQLHPPVYGPGAAVLQF